MREDEELIQEAKDILIYILDIDQNSFYKKSYVNKFVDNLLKVIELKRNIPVDYRLNSSNFEGDPHC